MDEDQGIVFFIGTLIISICIGTMFGALYGFLTLGSMLIVVVFIDRIWKTRDRKRKGE